MVIATKSVESPKAERKECGTGSGDDNERLTSTQQRVECVVNGVYPRYED